MEELLIGVDQETARRVKDFADSIDITVEEAATRLLRIAATVHEVMVAKGVLDENRPSEFVVAFDRHPDGVGAVDFRRVK